MLFFNYVIPLSSIHLLRYIILPHPGTYPESSNIIYKWIVIIIIIIIIIVIIIIIISIWGNASEYLLQPLIIIHKKIIRILSGSQNFHEPTTPHFKSLSLLNIPE